jgi:hypothetical protein
MRERRLPDSAFFNHRGKRIMVYFQLAAYAGLWALLVTMTAFVLNGRFSSRRTKFAATALFLGGVSSSLAVLAPPSPWSAIVCVAVSELVIVGMMIYAVRIIGQSSALIPGLAPAVSLLLLFFLVMLLPLVNREPIEVIGASTSAGIRGGSVFAFDLFFVGFVGLCAATWARRAFLDAPMRPTPLRRSTSEAATFCVFMVIGFSLVTLGPGVLLRKSSEVAAAEKVRDQLLEQFAVQVVQARVATACPRGYTLRDGACV